MLKSSYHSQEWQLQTTDFTFINDKLQNNDKYGR